MNTAFDLYMQITHSKPTAHLYTFTPSDEGTFYLILIRKDVFCHIVYYVPVCAKFLSSTSNSDHFQQII